MENNSSWTDTQINCLLALQGRLLHRQSWKEPIIVTDTYGVTTATHTDMLEMSGLTHPICSLANNSASQKT